MGGMHILNNGKPITVIQFNRRSKWYRGSSNGKIPCDRKAYFIEDLFYDDFNDDGSATYPQKIDAKSQIKRATPQSIY